MPDIKVLVVEDDRTLLGVLEYNLVKEGYRVFTAADGVRALDSARTSKPDFIILDVMLPEMGGFEVCRILRREMTAPILMLTARDDEVDKVAGLDLGADDYMTKPFKIRELLARIRAILRRVDSADDRPAQEPAPLKVSGIEIDVARHTVTLDGKPLSLTLKEFDLLAFLAASPGLVFSRDQLLEKVWGYDYPGGTRTVDVHVRWLREKMEADPSSPRRLVTVRGVGYKLEAQP